MKRLSGLLFAILIAAALIATIRPNLLDEIRGITPTVAPVQAPSPFRAVVVLPEDGPEAIVSELDAARFSIDLYVYLLPSEEILSSLERAHDRGVVVRVILEPDPFGGGGSNQESFDRLQAIGIDVKWADQRFQFSHIKLFLIDRTTAVIMTLNLSYTALTFNREFAVVTTDTADVDQVRALFEADWFDRDFQPIAPIVASPDNSRDSLSQLISRATVSIDIYAEVVRDREIRDQLISAVADGIRVRMLVPENPAGDDQTIYRELVGQGVEIKLLADVYSHAKAIIVDGVTAFVGSQNLTQTSLEENRELGIILSEPANLQRLNAVFEGDWSNSTPFP